MKSFLILIFTVLLSFNIWATSESESKLGVGFSMDFDYTSEFKVFINSQDNNPFKFGSGQHLLLTSINSNLKLDFKAMLFHSYYSRSGLGNESSSNMLLMDIAIGIYYMNNITRDFNIYYGSKVGTVFALSSSDSDLDDRVESNDENDIISIYFIPTMGAEYFFNSNLSISGEIGLKINILDDDSEKSMYYLSTLSSLLIKWYF